MIIGRGQLANAFKNVDRKDLLVFASGVPNSNCTDETQFRRERDLLFDTIREYPDATLIYFSSCALSADQYPKNAYYRHKANMEALIEAHCPKHYIFRLPQLFGALKEHSTLINFIYTKVMRDEPFSIFSDAHRYVIDIEDVVTFVVAYVNAKPELDTIDVANTYRYPVKEIVKTVEQLTGKAAKYDVVQKEDFYELDLEKTESFVNKFNLDLGFGSSYLSEKLSKRFQDTLAKSPPYF